MQHAKITFSQHTYAVDSTCHGRKCSSTGVLASLCFPVPPACREVVLLKCTLAEQRKHEQERVEAALKDQKRKIARREARQPSPLEKFLQTK